MTSPLFRFATRWPLALLLLLLLTSVGCGKPEAKLADHVTEMASILDSNADKPKAGAEALRDYLRKNLPDMLKLVGEMVAELDKIEDPSERAKRANEMMTAVQAAVVGAQAKALVFAAKAKDDEETKKYVMGIAESYEKMASEIGDAGSMLNLLGPRRKMDPKMDREGLMPKPTKAAPEQDKDE